MSIARRLILALVVAIAAAAPANAVERILLFVSDAQVQHNGDLIVTETIRVEAEGNQIRHGIFRDFPTTYTRPDGSRVVVGFDVQSVTRDGTSEPWTTEAFGNGVRVRIGNADVTIPNGPHEYVIRYRTDRQIGFFADYDELYWNATGNGWPFAIDSAEARITLPQSVPFRQAAFYTGPQGAQGRDAAIIQQTDGHIVFRTTRALPPGNGLTVAAAWQKGVVDAPTASQQAHWWLIDNLPGVVAGIGLAVVLAFYGFAWLRFGRDPPRGTIIPLFAPPADFSAAAVRFVERMGFDQRCFTAAIVDLGVHGHIRLSGDGSKTVITHVKEGKPVGGPESSLAGKLFASEESLALDQKNYKPIGAARDALRGGLAAAYDGPLFTDNFLWSGLGVFLSGALMGLVLVLMGQTYDSDRFGLMLFGVLAPLLPILGGCFMVRAGRRDDSGGGWWIAVGGILIAGFVFIGLALTATGAPSAVNFMPAIAAYVLVPLAFLGFHWLQAPTVAGRKIMDQIEGFRQYLGVAEEDRLNALNPPDKTPQLFERFLPYAIALDVENRWAKRFASVLAAAGASAAVGTWYSGRYDPTRDPVGFANHLGGALSSTIASAASPPGSSSGSGGGGSSGGGGGGGGGGGW
jgi:hypothetical protein